MTKELRLQSSTLSSSFHDDSDHGDGVQLHSTLKLNVLYYKKHTKTAIPATGTMRLSHKTLSFHSKGLEFIWNLDSICVDKFKGRVNGGIKIYGQRQMGEGCADDEFIFTSVKQRSYERIRISIDEAKFDNEMKKVRRASAHTIAMNDNDMKNLLSVLDERAVTTKQSSPLLMKSFQFIFSAICRLISFIHKICTGRRLWGPKDMHGALHGVLTNVTPILTVSKLTLSEARNCAIKKDVDSIHESLMTIRRVVQQQQPQFTSSGSVVDESGPTDPGAYLRQKAISISIVASAISYFVFTIRRLLNLKRYRYRWEAARLLSMEAYPSTVGQAVQNANDKLEALMELAINEGYPPATVTKIMGEGKRIQMLLYNVKVHSADVSQASPKEE